jgi:uncharacterized protein (TIGR02217 family)
MPDFHDTRFPTDISYGSEGGPEFSTEVVETASGAEYRNCNWEYPRERWNVAYGVREMGQLQLLSQFFYARQGKAHSFRFYNHDDHDAMASPTIKLTTAGKYQLTKEYTSGGYTFVRKITKPLSETLLVYVDGTLAQSTDWTLDSLTGIITFANGHHPITNAVVTATFSFDVPMRFDIDHLPINLADYKARSVTVPIIEVRE